MATVYLAHDLKHDRDVAIKVLHPDLGAALGGERFLSEIKTTARLQHPHILPLLDSGEADGLLYYVMPHVTGETLRARLERERQLPIEDALRIAREVADALGAAHAIGIIHRDIKPENILLQGGHALVADFGIALAVQSAGGQRMTQTGLSLGTPQYMSPEQAMGEKAIDARSDIYALGAVTYEMLLGEPPFTGPTVQTIVAKVLTERPTAPRAVRDTVPPGVEQAILKALAKLPADRFATAEKFADALADGRSAHRADGRSSRIVPQSACISGLVARWGCPGLPRPPCWAGGWEVARNHRARPGRSSPSSPTRPASRPARASRPMASRSPTRATRGGATTSSCSGSAAGIRCWWRAIPRLDEVWPAYSPDGTQIAYSVRGGGIFVVGATGSRRGVSPRFGSNPAWSPDGHRIVFGSEEVFTPYNVNATGTLWVVDASGGEPRQLAAAGVAGHVSAGLVALGQADRVLVATSGRRDLETVLADGGPRVKVTDDVAAGLGADLVTRRTLPLLRERPGRHDGSLADRGGRGLGDRRLAPRSLVASGVDVAMDLPQPLGDGTMLIFRSKLESVNPAAIAFDPVDRPRRRGHAAAASDRHSHAERRVAGWQVAGPGQRARPASGPVAHAAGRQRAPPTDRRRGRVTGIPGSRRMDRR